MKNNSRAEAVLVTGASGFLGQALVRRLAAEGCAVTAVARRKAKMSQPHWLYVERYEDVQSILSEQTCVVHLAARVHVMHENSADSLAEFRAANVDITLHLARQAAIAGVRRFVFLSSVKVNGEATLPGQVFTAGDQPAPQDSYGISKMEAERGLRRIAAETGMEVVVIRPPLVYGPGVRANFLALLRAVEHGLPLPLGSVDNRRSMVALDNLVDFILACINHPAAAGQTFLVSDGEDLSTAELVRRMAWAMRKPVRLIPVPVWLLQVGSALLGRRDVAQRLCSSLQVDIHKNRELLGWIPVINVDEGMRRTVAGWNL